MTKFTNIEALATSIGDNIERNKFFILLPVKNPGNTVYYYQVSESAETI